MYDYENAIPATAKHTPWNKGKLKPGQSLHFGPSLRVVYPK